MGGQKAVIAMADLAVLTSSTAEIVMDFLTKGLLCPTEFLRMHCYFALHALGPAAIPPLQAILDAGSLKPDYEWLVRDLVAKIQAGGREGDVQAAVLSALMGAWYLSYPKFQDQARQALELLCGPDYVNDMILAAISYMRIPKYSARLLRAAQECGRQPTAATWMAMLTRLPSTHSMKIRDQAAELVGVLSREGETLPGGIPPAFVAEFRYSLLSAAV